MKLLGIETSSSLFSVAVSDGPVVLDYRQADGQGSASTLLTDWVEAMLKKTGIPLSGLAGFAVSIGPGSFTGLRIGVMTVKTLAWSCKKPVLPVSSLEVIAHNLEKSPQPVVPFLDARKGNVYMACFIPDGRGGLQRSGPDELLRPEEALKRFPEPAVLVGDGVKKYADLLRSAAPAGTDFADPAQGIPRADVLCRLAGSQWPNGLMDDPHRLVPQYLYSQESDVAGS